MTDITSTSMSWLVNFLGGPEMAGLVILVFFAGYSFLNRGSLPTHIFVVFLIVGALYGEYGGIFTLIYGLVVVAGMLLTYAALKNPSLQT